VRDGTNVQLEPGGHNTQTLPACHTTNTPPHSVHEAEASTQNNKPRSRASAEEGEPSHVLTQLPSQRSHARDGLRRRAVNNSLRVSRPSNERTNMLK
jgi:hypothetical protein